jgi:hypothetical protein
MLLGTGDPTANTTAPGGDLAGSGWQYQGLWGGFLGTAISPYHFITAKHVGGAEGQTFSLLDGSATYTAVERVSDSPDSDLTIWRVDQAFGAYAPLYTGSDEVGKSLVVFGRGSQRGAEILNPNLELSGWRLGPSDGVVRWGENEVSSIQQGGAGLGELLRMTFDDNGLPDEAGLSSGDSSGAIFIEDEGIWKLAGLNYGVDGPFNTEPTGSGYQALIFDKGGLYEKFGSLWIEIPDQEPDIPSAFGATRISANKDWIVSVVPEPSTYVLLMVGGLLVLALRRRG